MNEASNTNSLSLLHVCEKEEAKDLVKEGKFLVKAVN